MKQVFWLLSALGLTFAQSSAAQSAYSNSSTQISYTASIPDDIDSVINSLIASSSNTQSQVNLQASNNTTLQNFSANFQSPISAVERLTSNSAPSIAAASASSAALSRSIGLCAKYVRRALQAAGYSFTPQPSAYQYANGTLASAGFVKLSNDNYAPQVGDVAVFNRTAKNIHGHIQIYDGNQWVSDFRQPKFSPYSQHNGYTVWRDARYNDASANTGTMLAMNDR